MNAQEIIENVVREGKWIKNNIGATRVQCFKLVEEEKKLMVIIVSDKLECPISSAVEKIMAMDTGIVLFYDGQYYQRVEKNEYDLYKKYLSKDEWNIVLGNEPIENLIKNDLISDKDEISAEVHDNTEAYISRSYDKSDTDKLNYIYNK
ncbi:hypothetical protein ACJDT4_07905 [Clostridium neuense]|uniref:Uncharacterized protein n=1 Tax=Clostridium neuense TaxID=1728934 RepID=A0ABW8TDL8_9CLOT